MTFLLPQELCHDLWIVRWTDHRGAVNEWTVLAKCKGEAWVWAVTHGADYRGQIDCQPYGT